MKELEILENKVKKAKLKELAIKNQLKNDFLNLIKKVFENKAISFIYWTQYTPFFNDGEECVFRVNYLNVVTDLEFCKIEDKYRDFAKVNKSNNSLFFYENEIDDTEVHLEMSDYKSISKLKNVETFAQQNDDMKTILLLSKISDMMRTDYFEKILLDTLGDHVKITIKNVDENIEVNIESYAHD
jgi:hypothetical protein